MLEAKKTEYRGIVFDSKSEAVLARAFDMTGQEWVYHPAEHCGHVWDFLVFLEHPCPGSIYVGGKHYWQQKGANVIVPMLIEYKPSIPTGTYIEKLVDDMRPKPLESCMIWGNPWDGVSPQSPTREIYNAIPIYTRHSGNGFNGRLKSGVALKNLQSCDLLGFTDSMAITARDYRFDLKGT